MHALFISHNFPPEVNAGAIRMYEYAQQWIRDHGEVVEVICPNPNYPEGKIHSGYQNRLNQENVDGIQVTRVPIYIAENKGTIKRTLGYVSFMLSAIRRCKKLNSRPEIVVGSSPQFFCALAGLVISRIYRVPFIFEVRDIWPDSIIAVGAMKRNLIIRIFEKLERFLYRRADLVLVVTHAFSEIIQERGATLDRIAVLRNGVALEHFTKPLDSEKLTSLQQQHNLKGKFVVSYLGTIGMAHHVEVMLEAAAKSKSENILFLVVGAGAERKNLEEKAKAMNLKNFMLLEKQPHDMMPYFLGLSDVSLVHLKDSPVFQSVIPSKMFEAMAMKKPIIMGVKGEAKAILEEGKAGIPITPESSDELLQAAEFLASHPEEYQAMAQSGHDYVCANYDRKQLARKYWTIMENLITKYKSSKKKKK